MMNDGEGVVSYPRFHHHRDHGISQVLEHAKVNKPLFGVGRGHGCNAGGSCFCGIPPSCFLLFLSFHERDMPRSPLRLRNVHG